MQTSKKLVLAGLIQAALFSTLLVVPVGVQASIANYLPTATLSLLATDAIYLYQNGVPVRQPDAYVQGGGVYEGSLLIGTLDAETGQIYSDNQVIGYVVSGT